MSNKIDYENIALSAKEISGLYKKISGCVPKEENMLLQHIAACSIHLSFFLKDVHNHQTGTDCKIDPDVKNFLDICGCKDKL